MLLALTGGAGAESEVAPSVWVVAPADGTATNGAAFEAVVGFRALGNVTQIVLEANGREVGRRANPPQRKAGEERFTVDLSGLAEGALTVRALAWQGAEPAGLRGESAPVTVTLDRTPPRLELIRPAEGSFFTRPAVQIEGSASDERSGLAGVTCDGQPATLGGGGGFSCAVTLAEGPNQILVRAADRAGNTSERTLILDYFPGGLAGAPAAPALAAVRDVFSDAAYVRADELSGSLVRTQVELAFRTDATVGEVNLLLRRIGGRIVSQREGVLIAVVRIPDPGSVEALEQLLEELALDRVVRIASRALVPEPAELPLIINATDNADLALVRHQLAVRAHAAWNARAALAAATVPTLVVGDEFGAGPPGEFFDVTETAADFFSGAPKQHGYHVLGIAAGTFAEVGGNAAADKVTGIFPGTIPLRATDLQLGLAGAAFDDRLLEQIENAPGNVVLNTSLQFDCETPADAAANCTAATANDNALLWIERVRGTDPAYSLEGKFLNATAAGNIGPGVGPLGAALSSERAAAAVRPLFVASGAVVSNLTNTLVVENFTATATRPFGPGCLSSNSEAGGTIAAIGDSVYSLAGPSTTATLSGTSMATPQVAGLAAYVWALRPGLSPAELLALLRRTAKATPGCGNGLVIDAYAALLAADEGNPARPARRAILDAADGSGQPGRNGAFDEFDLALYTDELDSRAGAIDYSRYDLNGDGATGSPLGPALPAAGARFDLDIDGSYGLATQSVESLPVRFDENAPTDLKVLCHAAYSPLYTGDTLARTALLGVEQCLRLDLETQFPTTVGAGQDNLLTVRLADLDLPDPTNAGDNLGQQGVRIELNPSGGTVDQFSGTTNADGVFQTNARLFTGQPELTIEVVARAGEGGPELARKTISAEAAEPIGPIGVTITPASATVGPGETVQLTATVEGSSNGVTWSSSAGSITDTGLFSPPLVDVPLTVTVTARSRDDLSKSASASIEVFPQSAWIGRWVGTVTSLVFGEMRTEPTIVVIAKTNPLLRVSNLELGTRSGRFIMFPGSALLPDGVTRLPDSTTFATSKINGLPSRLANCFASDVCRVDGTRRGNTLSLTLVPLVSGPRREEYNLVLATG